MQYLNWNKRIIKKQLSSLRQINYGHQYDNDINILNSLYNDKDIVPFECGFSLEEKLKYDKEKLNEYEYFIYIIDEFLDYKVDQDKIYYVDELSLGTKEILNFVYDFFGDVFPKWNDIFLSVFKEKKNNLRVNESNRCYEIYLKSLNYSYINFNRKQTIEDIYAIVHEYMHAVVDRIRYRSNYDNGYPFVELPTILSELICSDIIKDTYLNLEEQVSNYDQGSFNSYTCYAKDILDAYEFLNVTDLTEKDKDLLYDVKKYCRGQERTTNMLTSKLVLENIGYVVPFIYAVELYILYLNDPEKFEYNLNYIINMDNSNNYIEEMSKLGLEPNQSMEKYLNKIRRI